MWLSIHEVVSLCTHCQGCMQAYTTLFTINLVRGFNGNLYAMNVYYFVHILSFSCELLKSGLTVCTDVWHSL